MAEVTANPTVHEGGRIQKVTGAEAPQGKHLPSLCRKRITMHNEGPHADFWLSTLVPSVSSGGFGPLWV